MSRTNSIGPTMLVKAAQEQNRAARLILRAGRHPIAHRQVSQVVAHDRKAAKFWLEPVQLEYNLGFGTSELNKISALVRQHQAELVKAWHDYFKSGNGNRGGQAG